MALVSPATAIQPSRGLTAPNAASTLSAGFKPTPEQQNILDAFRQADRPTLVVEALAGTGKTTTLKAIANVDPRRPGVYIAFNKSIVNQAGSAFPQGVNVTTAHSLAYRAIGHLYADKLNSPRRGAQWIAATLKVRPTDVDGSMLNNVLATRLAQATVARYIKSADSSIGSHHLPPRAAHLNFDAAALAAVILPIANRIWDDARKVDGKLPFTHDHYLKLWSLGSPRLPYDYLMFDEAQDADPVIASIVARQTHAQRIYVGDQNQAIYGWRGAIDAMGRVEDARRLPLTKSFRFGPAIAEQGNAWLELLGSKLRVVGHDPIQSTVCDLDEPRAILCRTNGTALGWVLAFQERGIKVALAPGDRNAGKDIQQFAWAARDLMAGKGTDHPELSTFQTWSELLEYVEEEEDAADLKRLVNIINRVGVNAVIDAIRNLTPEAMAQVTVSTAHKAKGLEWDSVRVADDFTPPDPEADEEYDPAGLMLAYVTVTRAKLRLDPGSLREPELWSPR
jgi:superfamily I DNA/RNA helicase